MATPDFYGESLRIARLTAGLSLQELGEKVSTSRQYISQLETSDKKPSEDLLDALCFELKVAPDFFARPLGNLVHESECHFRKLKSVPVSATRECTARVTMVDKLVNALDSLLELPEVDVPDCSVIESKALSVAAARLCREYWQLGKGPISSVSRVIERAGGVITTFGDVSEKVDALSVFRSRPIIVMNKAKNRPRIRFDLAHELGHVILHRGVDAGCRTTEDEADQFASHFLLPQEALLVSYRPGSRIDWASLKQIKIKWGISFRAIIFRLRQADMITPSQYRTANIHLSKTGQTKSEHFDEAVPEEKPEMLSSSLRLLGETYGGSFGGLLDRLGVSRDLVADLTNCHDVLSDHRWADLGDNVLPIFPRRA